MDYKKVNENLKNFFSLRTGKKPVFKQIPGEYETGFIEVYDIGLPDGLMAKLTIEIDSYEHQEYISGVEFVRGREKTIISYE